MVKRFLGGIQSATQGSATASVASGIWGLTDQIRYQSSSSWPNANARTVIVTFTASGTWTCPTGVSSVEYLVVAGGGGRIILAYRGTYTNNGSITVAGGSGGAGSSGWSPSAGGDGSITTLQIL